MAKRHGRTTNAWGAVEVDDFEIEDLKKKRVAHSLTMKYLTHSTKIL